jgi:hypothetical protein
MHHANLLIGDRGWAYTQIPDEETVVSPDVRSLSFERMTIADARTLIHDAYRRPVLRTHRTFILACTTLLPDAQNALLKLLEEPQAAARFFLIVPSEQALVPTLRSRFHLLATQHDPIVMRAFESFHASSYAERLTEVAHRLEAEDAAWVTSIVRGFAHYAHESHDTNMMRDVLMVENHIGSPGASQKMLLEHLALSLPQSVR